MSMEVKTESIQFNRSKYHLSEKKKIRTVGWSVFTQQIRIYKTRFMKDFIIKYFGRMLALPAV